MFDKNFEHVVLIKKNKPEWQAGFLNGVGGKVEEFDECPLYAMIREFKEETGKDECNWVEFCTLYEEDQFEVICFFVDNKNIYDVRTMEKEEVVIIPVADLNKHKIVSNLSWLIPMIIDQPFEKEAVVEYRRKEKFIMRKNV